MKWFDGFPFKSKEQRQKEQQKFEKRVMPLGPAQKDAALRVLKELIHEKASDEELLFAYLNTRDRYETGKEDDPDVALEKARAGLNAPSNRLEPESRGFILALVRLEDGVTSLENYPTAEEVRVFAEESNAD